MRHYALPFVLLPAVLVLLGSAASFAQCGDVTEVPTFSETIDLTSSPAYPAEPLTRAVLESFRSTLEEFREFTVERYNRRLQRFGQRLEETGSLIQHAAQSGECDSADRDRLELLLKSEIRKLGTEYLETYSDGMTLYKIKMRWYWINKLA